MTTNQKLLTMQCDSFQHARTGKTFVIINIYFPLINTQDIHQESSNNKETLLHCALGLSRCSQLSTRSCYITSSDQHRARCTIKGTRQEHNIEHV